MKRTIIAALASLVLCGCSSTNITKLVAAAAKDPATIIIKVTTIYGNVSYTRIGVMTNETAQVTGDGTVTIKTTGQ
jgi:uncharacterized protein YcfL